MKYHLNPDKMHLSVGFSYMEGGVRKTVVFDDKNREHDIPADALPRLKEIHQGRKADVLPGPWTNDDEAEPVPQPGKPPLSAKPGTGAKDNKSPGKDKDDKP